METSLNRFFIHTAMKKFINTCTLMNQYMKHVNHHCKVYKTAGLNNKKNVLSFWHLTSTVHRFLPPSCCLKQDEIPTTKVFTHTYKYIILIYHPLRTFFRGD